MTKIHLEQHRKLTLPAEIIEQAHLQYGDVLEVSYVNGVIILCPPQKLQAAAPKKDIMEYAGVGKGVWGKTAAEIDANLDADRALWEP